MGRPGEGLARKFNRALQAVEEQERRAAAAREARLKEAREARDKLLDDLGAFGEAVGHLQVQAKADDNGLTIRYRDRFVTFAPMGGGDRLEIRFSGSDTHEHRLYREAELGNRWVWVARHGGREDRLPFFDTGLEQLMVRALGLPDPDHVPDVVPEETATLEDAIPASRSL